MIEKSITVEKKQEIINDVAQPVKYWISYSFGVYSNGFHLDEPEAKELLKKLQQLLK